jgi:biopolymer transport protein ExbD
MNLRRKWKEQSEVHTSALNDVLFILLFFFLIISTLANPNLVKVSIPKSSTDTKAKQTIVVTVDSLENFYIGTKPVSVDSLMNRLVIEASKLDDQDPTIVVNGDVGANWGNDFEVIKQAKKLNLKTVVAVDKD